ncbi:hypothetical protein A2926_03155 [Candidatus Giovannonibacteria bacterium RIFCSPLOWO2_01_FULL_44_40]|uniref:histidine kinase n=1 Tax=Candidatus Giovannonibacteria bacterium RIFCSPHIGHO2_01_FULL_45_23 TaxID=1798325 RepID=A0A1F5VE40_9BACT|nr:MAG: hypothetical protein A2834_00725 [Candidatus Giovannonibacteria bacterium RIFCSPHIGHO2_01_FULL_45_23]OGF75766.1 MAG: hypothetical protein A3C77_02540 [Candidatus Giovannonibacteria bacterium RIFCSPHIGHO2_02_FULL_45_13]OGF79855.1 MAG: hypothetical protein A2926_03155 [Candidatus Giovannonibacteria bacterium RIFCSPLOWO2_01_FULL_44_40]
MISKFFKMIAGSPLRNKFTLFFIVLSTFPILVLGGTTLFLIDLSHRHDVSELETQLIDQKIEEIEKFFADTLGILELRVGFTQKSEIDLAQQKFLLEGLLEENRAFEEVSLINLKGLETSKLIRGTDEADLLDVSNLNKFKNAAAGENYIGPVYYTLSGPFTTLSAPVRNRLSDVIQVLSAEVNLSQIIKSIETARLGSSGYLALLDKDGSVAAYRGQKNVNIGFNLASLDRVGRVLKGESFDALGDQDRYQSVFSLRPVVGAGKLIQKIGWAILSEWPLEDANVLIQDIRRQILNLTLLGIVSVVVLAFLFAARLLEPISKLEKSASEIEQGNFEKKVDIKTGDELEDLGAAFNKMTAGLRRLQELKNEFVFIAAHELRAPVTAIKGYISMILEGSAGVLPETAKKYLEPVAQANERLIRLVNDILEIARSEAGRITIEVFAVDISHLIADTIEELKPLADEKKIALSYEQSKTLLVALTDTTRFKEIIINLISNAIKYNNEGGWVKIYNEDMVDMIATHVEDGGFGMSEEDQKHMFEKFFRAETGKTKAVIGTGLGMFITKELVEKMGGKIWFRSKEGSGSRFSVSFKKPS